MVGRRHDEGVCIALLDHLQKTAQDTVDLPDVIAKSALRADAVEIVKQVDTARLSHELLQRRRRSSYEPATDR